MAITQIPQLLQDVMTNPSISNYSITNNDSGLVVSDFQRGESLRRKQFIPYYNVIIEMDVILSKSQVNLFNKWYRNDLKHGTIPFQFDHQRTPNWKIGRAIFDTQNNLIFRPIAADRFWSVSLRLYGISVITDTVIPDDIEEVLCYIDYDTWGDLLAALILADTSLTSLNNTFSLRGD